jgi:ATP-dependent protease ClpP protease subunit
MPINPDKPALTQSEYDRFDFAYAKDLKDNYPRIWKAGGNIRGNEAFEYYTKYREGEKTEGTLQWVSEREAWCARHFEDGAQFKDDTSPNLSNIAGVVAQIKWACVGTLGEKRMKEVINTVKAKISDSSLTQITNKAEGVEVVLSGEVGNWDVSARQIADAIENKTGVPLTIKINSVGGDVFEGFALYNAIKMHEGPTTAIVEGLAASAASLFAMAADVVVMRPASMMMVHNPHTVAAGESKDLRQSADVLDKVRDIMVQRYKTKTGQPEESLIEMLEAETWLTPEEAVELGFADKVDYSEEQVGGLHSSLITKITAMFKTKSQIVEALTSDEIKDLALGLDVSAKLELVKALADNVEGVEEVCVKLGEGEEKYMSAPEVAVIPMEGHAMLIALGVLEERVVEAEDHEAMDEEEEEAMYHDDEEEEAKASVEAEVEAEAETEVKSEVETLSDVVAELKAQMEELKEERAAMKVHTPDNKATKLDWKEVAIQNALKFKK